MAVPSKYQAKEVLNKVLNSGEDALNVDLSDSVTVTVDSEFPAAAAITDDFANPTTTSAMSMLMGWDTSTWDRVQIGDGTAASALRVTISTNDSHFGAVGAASDVDGVIHGQLRYIGAGVDTVETSANAIQTAVEAVNQAAEGTISSTTQRVTIATDDDGVAHLATIAGAVSTQMQVDVVAALPAGDNNIGNVDIVTLPASTNTIEVVGDAAEDAAVAGNPVLAGGRYDSTARTLDDGDVGALALDPSGALYTREYLGQAGSILVTGTSNAVTTGVSGTKFVAIQFLEDTTFDTGSTGLVASTTGLWPDDANASTTIDGDGGAVTGSEVFPQGMTIFGRWDGFKLDSGKVIGYLGYV